MFIVEETNGIKLIETNYTKFGLPIYEVWTPESTLRFTGETAYTDAYREFFDEAFKYRY